MSFVDWFISVFGVYGNYDFPYLIAMLVLFVIICVLIISTFFGIISSIFKR